ncbi:hypothetical protein SAMN02745885_01609 [Carboxydocella sporoproducens DSM 16521]|uniref:Uncharacterized protein n=2 Tax=Carboxydocella TaxID=178898 RepID=A0A1T4QCD3_9FIRM|nr:MULTISPECIES: hypothetical protein [Carboxydocella]AVX21642.1 hypothetical protein CFE_2499 [Carboxydocella thermautotrophica]SKA01297.1 hypothetical protein SAMN02745885_01609 [Carboxydocella sporoproducens DSM 16521]
MYLFLGGLGVLIFCISLIKAVSQRKSRIRFYFWAILNFIGVTLVVIALSMNYDPSVQPAQQIQHEQLQKQNNAEAKKLLNKLNKYLYENFGGAGNTKYQVWWYRLIKEISLAITDDGKVVVGVDTDIYPDAEGERLAKLIGNVVLTNDKVNINRVSVYGQNNSLLFESSKY